jgi:hypothetical protein
MQNAQFRLDRAAFFIVHCASCIETFVKCGLPHLNRTVLIENRTVSADFLTVFDLKIADFGSRGGYARV